MDYQLVTSSGGRPVFEQSGILPDNKKLTSSMSEISRILDKYNPDVVLSGRSIKRTSAERLFIICSRARGIPTVAIVDDWYDYRENFCDEQNNLTHLPDIVCCPDDQAKREAIADGLPREILKVTGSPALTALYEKLDQYSKSPPPCPDVIRKCSKHPIILFISEEIAAIKSNHSRDNEYFLGYDQHSVREDLVEILSHQFDKCSVIEKIHPETRGESYSRIEKANVDWWTLNNDDIYSLCWWSDLVIGMRSMGLMETAILGKPTVSYQPNLLQENRCTAVRKDLIRCCQSASTLQKWLDSYELDRKRQHLERPSYANEDSIQTVFSILRDLTDYSIPLSINRKSKTEKESF
jgi:predicted glycosyltransferase